MDGSTVISKSKMQKLNEEHNNDEGSKSLSTLPDAVLQHILSFLSTKDAVKTSILSKRWEYMWISIPNLEFHEIEPLKSTAFMNFVERVLVLRDSFNINEFSLFSHVISDTSRVNSWISAAVRRNAQRIYICIDNLKDPFALPRCLFTSATLKELEVEMPYILKLPPSICFSSLKLLTLKSITFSDDHSTQQLFSGCPVLEELSMYDCNWVKLKVVSILVPKLRSLIIRDMEFNMHSGRSHSDGCQVMIFATGLKSFDYCGELFNEYCLYNSISLDEASINVDYGFSRLRQVAFRTYKLLGGLSHVEQLVLSLGAVEVLNHVTEFLVHLPLFKDLNHLVLDPGPVEFDCKALLQMLQIFPCLKTLDFLEGITLSSNCEGDDWILDPMPPCFLSHLKSIKVHLFYGSEEEVCAVKILLRNATVLDRMLIYFPEQFRGGVENQKKVQEQLAEVSPGSKSCKIIFN